MSAQCDSTAEHRARRTLVVPDRPIIPFIEGDGTGPDIWRASVRVFDAAVAARLRRPAQDRVARSARRREGVQQDGELATRRDARGVPQVSRRHQRTAHDAGRRRHPVAQRRAAPGTGFVRLSAAGAVFQGMETPVKRPDLVDMVIFRENTEDIYAGIEFQRRHARSGGVQEASSRRRFRSSTRRCASRRRAAFGIKPISREGSERLVRAAIDYAIANKRKSLTLVHKGNIMKFTEGALP